MSKMLKKIVAVLCAITMLAALFATPLTPVAETSALSSSDFLKANGKYVRNNYGSGDVVYLRGTNAGGWLVQEFWMGVTQYSDNVSCEQDIYNYLPQRFGQSSADALVKLYQDNYWTEKDFDNCAALGMNCIRLPFWWRNIVDANGNYYSNAWDRIDWFVSEAGERGMYVILDFHGAPGSQNGSDHSGVDGHDAKQAASEFFFGNNAYNNQQLYYDILWKMAQRYAGNPTVAAYDILNEPYCTYRYDTGYSDDYLHSMLWSIYDIAYDVIRGSDPDHMIIMEATWDPWDLPNPSDYGWTNVMYEYHNYNYGDYDNTAGQQITSLQNKVNSINNYNYNVPSYMGEFALMNNYDAWDQGLAILNNNNLHWTTWTYKVNSSSSYKNWGLFYQDIYSTNLETDSYDTIYSAWANSGYCYANTQLHNVIKNYLPGTVGNSSNSGSGTTSGTSAVIANGDYYFKGVNTGKVICADNYGNDVLLANRDAFGGDWEKLTIVNNSDGTISLKSGANGLYVTMVNDENQQLLARGSSIQDWEKFQLVKVTDTQFALKSPVNGMYVTINENDSNRLYATASAVQAWEVFYIYTTAGSQVGGTAATTTTTTTTTTTKATTTTTTTATTATTAAPATNGIANGDYYLKGVNTGKVICADNYGNDTLIGNRDAFGGDWEKFTIVNNSDGTISLKSGANGLYVTMVNDENQQLLARGSSIQDWEKFYLEKITDTQYALKSAVNGMYVTINENDSNRLYATASAVQAWEVFYIYTTSGAQV